MTRARRIALVLALLLLLGGAGFRLFRGAFRSGPAVLPPAPPVDPPRGEAPARPVARGVYRISGRVTRGTPAVPAPGARLRLACPGLLVQGRASFDGTFTMASGEAGPAMLLAWTEDGRETATLDLVPGTIADLVVATAPSPSFEGVVQADGVPVPAAMVQMRLPGRVDAGTWLVESDTAGRFRFPRFGPGEVALSARSPAGRSRESVTNATEAVTLALLDAPPPPRLQFSGPAGAVFPLAVEFMTPDGFTFVTLTDSAGRIELDGMSTGRHRVRFPGSAWRLAAEWVLLEPDARFELLPR